MAEFESDYAADDHGQEHNLQEGSGFGTGDHGVHDGQGRADADSDGVGRSGGQVPHRVGEAGHAGEQ